MNRSAIIRQLDSLGRVVIPVEMRRKLNIDNRDCVEICCDGDRIVITKPSDGCVFCGNDGNILRFRDKCICADCLAQLKK